MVGGVDDGWCWGFLLGFWGLLFEGPPGTGL